MKILAVFLFLCSTCIAQTVEVKSIVTGADGFKIVQGQIFVPTGSKLAVQEVGLVTVPSEWLSDPEKSVQIIIEDGEDNPIPYITLGNGAFQVNGTGIVKVQIVNPSPFYFNRWKIVLGMPGPKPDPKPDPPIPPKPVVIDNTYEVGQVAYDKAPKHLDTTEKYAKIYEQAGNFLFGDPTLKAIEFPNPADNLNPDKSVLAWMSREINLIPCPDLKTCQQWKDWQAAIRTAFTNRQNKSQFTRQDWYRAFNEVASALRQVK